MNWIHIEQWTWTLNTRICHGHLERYFHFSDDWVNLRAKTIFRFIQEKKQTVRLRASQSMANLFVLSYKNKRLQKVTNTHSYDPFENGHIYVKRTLLVLHIYRKDLSCGFDGIAHKLFAMFSMQCFFYFFRHNKKQWAPKNFLKTQNQNQIHA